MIGSMISTQNTLMSGLQDAGGSNIKKPQYESHLDCYESSDLLLPSIIESKAIVLKDTGKDSGTISSDNDCGGKLTELESFTSFARSLPGLTSDSLDMTMTKTEPYQAYPFPKPSETPYMTFYSDSCVSNLEAPLNNSTICDTDNMFDDAFSLDEFMLGQQDIPGMNGGSDDRHWQQDKRYSYSYTASFANEQTTTHISSCKEVDQCPEMFQPVMTNVKHSNSPFFNEIRNRTFSDLLHGDSAIDSAVDVQSPNFPNCANMNRARDYSVSSDSGVGSSILMDATTSPPSSHMTERSPQNPTFSTDRSSVDYMKGGIKNEFVRTDGFPSHISDSSRKSSTDNYSSGDCIIEEISPSLEEKTSPSNEKISSKKTAYNEKWGVKVLKAWCVEMSVPEDFEGLSPEEFNNLLCRFWTEVRKSNGDYYGRNSLFNLRAMINKHLKGKPYCATFDIVTDERFRSSNDRLEKQLKMLKGIGKTITHKQPISIADLRKMYDSNVLGTINPLSLLRKVWFEITLHFCHKGSEPQEKLSRTSFQIYRDHNFRAYISRAPNSKSSNDSDEVRMYETGGELCPVQSFQMYMRKLHPLQGRLFQQPRRKSTPTSPMWYGKAPIGEKALQQMMANISVAAKLSKRYTNHCVRTTALEQFSNSRRKSGSKNANEKCRTSMNKSPTILNDNKNHPRYSAAQATPNGFYQAQTQQVFAPHAPPQHTISYYQYNMPISNGTNENIDVNDAVNSPSPIKSCDVREQPGNRDSHCYKRSLSVAFPESTQNVNLPYHSAPPPPYPRQSMTKRPRLDSCQVFLSRETVSNGNGPVSYNTNNSGRSHLEHVYQNYPEEAYGMRGPMHSTVAECEGIPSMTEMFSPKKGLSETIVAGSNLPDVNQTQCANFTILPNIAL